MALAGASAEARIASSASRAPATRAESSCPVAVTVKTFSRLRSTRTSRFCRTRLAGDGARGETASLPAARRRSGRRRLSLTRRDPPALVEETPRCLRAAVLPAATEYGSGDAGAARDRGVRSTGFRRGRGTPQPNGYTTTRSSNCPATSCCRAVRRELKRLRAVTARSTAVSSRSDSRAPRPCARTSGSRDLSSSTARSQVARRCMKWRSAVCSSCATTGSLDFARSPRPRRLGRRPWPVPAARRSAGRGAVLPLSPGRSSAHRRLQLDQPA